MALLPNPAKDSKSMIGVEIVTRTLFIQYGQCTGSGFVFDYLSRQYIVTAKHVVDSIDRQGKICINLDSNWHELSVNLVGVPQNGADVAVLCAGTRLSLSSCPEGKSGEIFYGHQVYFLGFPFGMSMPPSRPTSGSFPVPFIKQGIVSAMGVQIDGNRVICLDGFNNPGLSGGPAVYHPNPFKPMGERNPTKILGIISGYRFDSEPIYVENEGQEELTSLIYKANTGIVIVHPISDAISVIESNPVGFILD